MKRHNFWKIRGGAGTALAVALLLLSFTAAWASDVLEGVRTEVVSKNSLGQMADGWNDPLNVRNYSTRHVTVSQHPYPNESANSPLQDGRIVAYTSKVGNLYPLGGDPKWNVYINDLGGQINMGAAYLVSQTESGNQGDGDSAFARVDPSGQFVVFQSSAEDFASFPNKTVDARIIQVETGNNPGKSDIFIVSMGPDVNPSPTTPINLSIGINKLLSNQSEVFYEYASEDSGYLEGGSYDQRAQSANFEWPFTIYRTYSGNYAGIGPAVIFQSRATNFETGTVNSLTAGRSHLYVMQLQYSSHTLSLAVTGFPPSQPALLTKGYDCGAEAHYSCEANGESSGPAVSSGGRRFDDGGVKKGDFNLTEDGFPVAGRYVVFTSTATNLIPGMDASDYTPGTSNVFLLDRDPDMDGKLVGITVENDGNLSMLDFDPAYTYFTLISHAYGDPTRAGNGASSFPSISADGKRIAYQSKADNLVAPAGDINGKQDIFLKDLNTGTTQLVSIWSDSTKKNNQDSYRPAMSGDGELIAFETEGVLVSDDTNDRSDIYIRKPSISLTWRASLSKDGRQTISEFGKLTHSSALSWTGQYVYFSSNTSFDDENPSYRPNVQILFRDQANPPNNPDVSPTSMMLGYVPYDETRSKTFEVTVQAAIKIRSISVTGDRKRFKVTGTTCPTGDVEVAPGSELAPYKCEITVSFYSDGLGGMHTEKLLIAVDDRPYESNPAEYNRELQIYLEADGATVLYLPLLSGPSDPQP